MTDQVFIGVAALFFAVMGLVALVRPDRVTSQFGIAPLNEDGRSEVRAVYGGYGLAMALALALAVVHPPLRPGIALTVALALCGMAGGRIVSALADRRMGRAPAFYFGLEILVAILLFTAV
ncbi:MAG: DUF4345 family protein [Parvularculaceae bacterium]|nr:DUF4345 family protein [Parvularculaceae bacterium]